MFFKAIFMTFLAPLPQAFCSSPLQQRAVTALQKVFFRYFLVLLSILGNAVLQFCDKIFFFRSTDFL